MPHNWVALSAFLIVSIVASRLSTAARAKAQEALDRRNELTRLFDLTRDILLTTQREGAVAAIARHVSRRFELDTVAICVPAAAGGWRIEHGGAAAPSLAGVGSRSGLRGGDRHDGVRRAHPIVRRTARSDVAGRADRAGAGADRRPRHRAARHRRAPAGAGDP